MFTKTIRKLVWGTVFLGFAGAAMADVLLIEKVRERMQLDLPGNGISMERVEQRWGQPDRRFSPVGDPPITRWDYDGFSVFFEHDLVIESVVHHTAVVRRVSSH